MHIFVCIKLRLIKVLHLGFQKEKKKKQNLWVQIPSNKAFNEQVAYAV